MTGPFLTPTEATALSEQAALDRGELFDHLGRRRIIHPDYVGSDAPKLVSYTRVTTFISAIEDSTNLQRWRTRLTLEGCLEEDVAFEASMHNAYQRKLNDSPDDDAKACEAAAKVYRADVQEIADRAFHHAGGFDSADYGTALHELADFWHQGSLKDAHLDDAEEAWPGIVSDFVAYRDAFTEFAEATNLRTLFMEALLVDDRVGLSGRTDLIAAARLPGDQRARRVILDIKTGKIDSGLKLSQQLAKYADSKLYNPETGERSSHRARRDIAIVIHVPRGEARAEFHIVQLAPGRAANVLCEKVRAARRKVPGIVTRLDLEAINAND